MDSVSGRAQKGANLQSGAALPAKRSTKRVKEAEQASSRKRGTAQINPAKRRKLTIKKNDTGSDEVTAPDVVKQEIMCPIGFEDLSDEKNLVCATRCGHIFCHPCISMELKRSGCCPICRRKQTEKQLITLHLPFTTYI